MEQNGRIEERDWFLLDDGTATKYLLISSQQEAEAGARAMNERKLIGDRRHYRVVRVKLQVVENIVVATHHS